MSKSKKNNKKPSVKGVVDDDDDWDAILSQEIKTNESLKPIEAQPVQNIEPTQEAEDDEDDDEAEEAGGDSKKDNKKKKKKKAKKDDKTKKAEVPLTATGKAILLRQQQLAAEEERIRKLQEEEERRIREEEERIEAERKAIEDEKERKRKAKANKVEAQKAAGTYMTKSEKEKQKKAQMRLEAMKAAGMVIPSEEAALLKAKLSSGTSENGNAKLKPSELLKKKPQVKSQFQPEVSSTTSSNNNKEDEDVDIEGESEEPLSPITTQIETLKIDNNTKEVPVAPEDDEDSGDDWETADLDLNAIAQKANAFVNPNIEIDGLEIEKKQELEKLRVLGIERARREEEARIKKEEDDKLRAEMERREREAAQRKEISRKRRNQRDELARAARSPTVLRSAISCIMGHVDTGKTKLLDKIRHTNVQEGEAGGITQQIGATQFSKETLSLQTACLQADQPFDIHLPGLLVIDTPGHESFTNLRSRGSSLCDIAILVIDLMHGLEQQTIESLNMLKRKRTPFVVALNKVDRCYGWKSIPDTPIRHALARQDENTIFEFKDRSSRIRAQLMEQGLNAALYWENDDLAHTVSLVPTSAITGEGVPDLLKMVITLTQERLQEKLMYCDALQCTVLEVKVIDGLGHTVDVVLVNGRLKEGDTIVVSTMEGPVVSSIRALLTPPPNREMRVKSEYVHHQELQGAIGIKIVGPDLSRVIAGTPVLVVEEGDDLDDVKEDVQSDVTAVMKTLGTDSEGVMVQASTLGALEALLQFLREECKPPIPVSHVGIGPIHKKDIMRANIMNEKGKPEFATVLAFDVRVDADAVTMADENHVRIFTAEIIYHLFDQFSAYMNGIRESRRAEAEAIAVFPCVLKIFPQHIFNKKDPIVVGVEVLEGTLKLNTPLTVPSTGFVDIGRVTSIENNHKEISVAKKGMSVAIKISNESNPTMTYGRQFDHTSPLYSKIDRHSIDALKEYFKDDMTKDDWQLIIKMKKVFNIT